MSAQLAHCILERKRAYTSHTAYKSSTVYSWYAGDRALKKRKKKYFFFFQSIWIIIFNNNPYFFKKNKQTKEHFVWFCPWSLFKNRKKRKEKKQCREWVNTLMYGSPVLETYWSWTIRYQAWTLFRGGGGGDRFAVLERCATQDNPNGCITNSTQNIRYRKEQQF